MLEVNAVPISETLRDSIKRRFCTMLPDGDGWLVLAVPSACVYCGTMHALHVVRQLKDYTWRAACYRCDGELG